MSIWILALLAPGIPQADPEEGFVVERSVRRTVIDTLGRRREVHRKEVIRLRGSDLSVTDLTFGERLIVRPVLKRIWRADTLAGEISELAFDDAARLRKRALDELVAVVKRVPGTEDERELKALLEDLGRFETAPKVEMSAEGDRRTLIVNGERVRLSAQVDPKVRAPGYFEALAAVGAFSPAVSEKLKALEGFPVKGTLRYVLFLDRVIERFEVTSIRRERIPNSAFKPPEGLKKIPWAGLEPAKVEKP